MTLNLYYVLNQFLLGCYQAELEVQLKPALDVFFGCVPNPGGAALPCRKFNPFTFIGVLHTVLLIPRMEPAVHQPSQ